ncbi:HAD hydrolase family protein [bacterium]|nr:HAD hydrolase family protein [bacterium]
MTLKIDKNIKLIISDFDGVFTDGGAYINEDGTISKKINFLDVMGIYILLRAGYKFAIISGEKGKPIEYFRTKLNIEDIYQDIREKAPVVEELLEKYNLTKDEVAYIGDDINDIKPMELVKYAFAPQNANYKVKQLPHIQVISKNGGNGAIRELIDTLLEQ